MIILDTLRSYFERYAELPMAPLEIVLELLPGARLAGYDPLNLDNLLARCVVDEATGGQGLPDEPGAYALPVPIHCLWRSPQGLDPAAMEAGAFCAGVVDGHARHASFSQGGHPS